MKKITVLLLGMILLSAASGCSSQVAENSEGENKVQMYTIPSESSAHDGTWLTWPHEYTYGLTYRREVEPVWVEMTKALVPGEKVHIIAYDESEKERITGVLRDGGIDLGNIDFTIAESDDVWVRDTGPIFGFDRDGALTILDFGFNGWGKKTPYEKDDAIPVQVSKATGIPLVSIPELVLEGGAMELDGAGTFLACRSSVTNKNRNPNLSEEQIEEYLQQYLGVTNFIWLDGSSGEEITDAHIDGIARFYDANTILTVSREDLLDLYENIPETDADVLRSAVNADGKKYEVIEMPLTRKNVKGLDFKGSYLNFYVGNEVVLLPVYNDENDAEAEKILEDLYPEREIVPIDVTALYQYGGMLHCVTQQQPAEQSD